MSQLMAVYHAFLGVVLKRPFICAGVLGALFTLGFAPFFLWPLAMLALAGLVLMIQKTDSVRRAVVMGTLFGFVHHLTALHWLGKSFYISFGRWDVALAVAIPAVLIVALYFALYVAIAAGVYRWLLTKLNTYCAPLAFTGLFVGLEYVRSFLPSVFPWNLTGYMWADNIYLMQLASVGSVFALCFAFVFAASLLAGRSNQRIFAVFVVVFVAAWGYFRLEFGEGAKPAEALDVSVVVAQPNIDQMEKWRSGRLRALEWLTSQTAQVIADAEHPVLAVWPETAVVYDLEERASLRAELGRSLREGDALLTGYPHAFRDAEDGERYARNSLMALDASGHIISDIYSKEYLIPWGEYMPFFSSMPQFVKDLWGARLQFKPDNNPAALVSIPLKDGRNIDVLPLVCGEAVMPFLTHKRMAMAGKKPALIVVVTNDAWFDYTIGPFQHYAMVRMRAVEQGVPLVRAANTGVSAVVDAFGREVKRFNMKHTGVLKWDM